MALTSWGTRSTHLLLPLSFSERKSNFYLRRFTIDLSLLLKIVKFTLGVRAGCLYCEQG